MADALLGLLYLKKWLDNRIARIMEKGLGQADGRSTAGAAAPWLLHFLAAARRRCYPSNTPSARVGRL